MSIDLVGDVEREAALEAIAELYGSIGRPFQVLSVRAVRDPGEHLAHMVERGEGRRIERAMAAYGAVYRELAMAQQGLRRTVLLVDAASTPELRRTEDGLVRAAEDHGIPARLLLPDEVHALRDRCLTIGGPARIEPGLVSGGTVATALVPSRRWPAQVEPGWLTALLATDGVGAVSMRVRPMGRAEAMSFMTTRLRQVRAADRLAAERGELADVERERVGVTATAARRAVHAGAGRIYLVDTVLLVEAADRAALA
ncbi:MAG: hypothetical protein WCK58_19070, partial [Chloroflexota bacterium]